jgi:hypothetical protein
LLHDTTASQDIDGVGVADSAQLQIFTTMQTRFEMARTHLVLTELAHLQGHHPDIPTCLGTALQLFQTLQVVPYVEHTVALRRRMALCSPLRPGNCATTSRR